jgi:hypothetical protein
MEISELMSETPSATAATTVAPSSYHAIVGPPSQLPVRARAASPHLGE